MLEIIQMKEWDCQWDTEELKRTKKMTKINLTISEKLIRRYKCHYDIESRPKVHIENLLFENL